jgi:hypothetical protein
VERGWERERECVQDIDNDTHGPHVDGVRVRVLGEDLRSCDTEEEEDGEQRKARARVKGSG